MTKTTTYISNQGETFTGTQKELMATYGIKNRVGFNRPSGAPDASGDRWLTEDKFNEQGGVRKQTLFLGDRQVTIKHKNGFIETYIEAACDSAANYTLAKSCLAGELSDVDPAVLPALQQMVKNVESQYDVIDNNIDGYKDTTELNELRKFNKNHPDDAGCDVKHQRILQIEKERDEWKKEKLFKASNAAIASAQDLRSSDRGLLKMAAMAGKLAEYKAGTWSPE